MTEPAYDILIVEDSRTIRERVRGLLAESKLAAFTLHEARTLAQGLEILGDGTFDAVLLDLGLPDSAGLDTIEAVRKAVPGAAVVILTADDRDETVMTAIRQGTQDYLLKEEISGPLLSRSLRYAIERNRLEEELRRNANTDALTGLFSRRHLMDTLDIAMAQARRYGHPLTVCICDVDNLKDVNDACGHRTGDEVLATFGTLVKKTLRESDFAGRYGGDEFIVAFPHTLPEKAFHPVERLRKSLDEAVFHAPDGKDFTITCTFGIAGGESEVWKSKDLIHEADKALYLAKKQGRNRVMIIRPDAS
jgi:diguanylate cyclase (GGDEF)-like protein